MHFNIVKAWSEMLELIDKSKTAKHFMWLTYTVFLAALLIWKPDIINILAALAQ
jgi:hypothetical protein